MYGHTDLMTNDEFKALRPGQLIAPIESCYPHPKRPYRVVRHAAYGVKLKTPGLKRFVRAGDPRLWMVLQ